MTIISLWLGYIASSMAHFGFYSPPQDGRYPFHILPISIQVPQATHLKMAKVIKERYEDVDFYKEDVYWQLGGRFSVQIYKVKELKDVSAYYKKTVSFFKEYMVKDSRAYLPHAHIISTKKLKINQHYAYQAIALDKLTEPHGALIATSIYYPKEKAAVIVALLQPLQQNGHIELKAYNQFLYSIGIVE